MEYLNKVKETEDVSYVEGGWRCEVMHEHHNKFDTTNLYLDK